MFINCLSFWKGFVVLIFPWNSSGWNSSCSEPKPIPRSVWLRCQALCRRCTRSHWPRYFRKSCWVYCRDNSGLLHLLLFPCETRLGPILLLLPSISPGLGPQFLFLCWPQGVGGAVELAPGYLKLVYDIVRKAGGVCIADEVQTGFGRTGSHYWGFETQGVIPDIVTMAKVFHLPLRALSLVLFC